jgi:hypothetical protein
LKQVLTDTTATMNVGLSPRLKTTSTEPLTTIFLMRPDADLIVAIHIESFKQNAGSASRAFHARPGAVF